MNTILQGDVSWFDNVTLNNLNNKTECKVTLLFNGHNHNRSCTNCLTPILFPVKKNSIKSCLLEVMESYRAVL